MPAGTHIRHVCVRRILYITTALDGTVPPTGRERSRSGTGAEDPLTPKCRP